jgi:hypothetical protein
MKKAIAILAAAFAVYMWGFLFWGASTLPYQAWERAADDSAAQQAIREHFPRNGFYGIPSVQHDAATLETLATTGPTALVVVTAADGRPPMVPSVLIFGFLHMILVTALVAALLSCIGGALSFGRKVQLTVLVGVISAVQSQFGDAIWWMYPWDWKLIVSIYEIGAFFIMGVILAKMLPARA